MVSGLAVMVEMVISRTERLEKWRLNKSPTGPCAPASLRCKIPERHQSLQPHFAMTLAPWAELPRTPPPGPLPLQPP